MLLKLFSLPSLYRQRSFDRVEIYERDVTMLIRDYHPDLELIFNELSNHLLPSDLDEIRGIVQEVEGRIKRSLRRFGNGE